MTLSDPASATPSFTAPLLAGGMTGNQTLTFRLDVSGGGTTSADTVDVTVKNVDHAPAADAGPDQTVNEASPVSLSGLASYDPDGDALTTFAWVQTGGPSVALTGADTAQPSFVAPALPGGVGGAAILSFELTVSDGLQSGTDEVRVAVEQVNHAPVADAGPDITKAAGSLVQLIGSGADPDGDAILGYQWVQTTGPAVTLSDPASAAPTFPAPATASTLTFTLQVSDGETLSAPDEVRVTVLESNDPPACTAARASQSVLWPPNHKLVPVTIAGLSDPDGDPVQVTINGVRQDEPVNGLGDGDSSPDAVVQTGGVVLLRVERAGGGNGRVYAVSFTARDGHGGQCDGTVRISAPPNMRPPAGAVDDGPLYESTRP